MPFNTFQKLIFMLNFYEKFQYPIPKCQSGMMFFKLRKNFLIFWKFCEKIKKRKPESTLTAMKILILYHKTFQ